MSKLSKVEAKAHEQACELLKQDVLSQDDKDFVLANWQESATHVNTTAGAFFTPPGLAGDFSIELACDMPSRPTRVIDLCAGIGSLARSVWERSSWNDHRPEITCVELNPDYIAVGRKILPEANWVQADVFALPFVGGFDYAISNPPFGATPRKGGKSSRYTGASFEYHVIDIAGTVAAIGVFIVPQQSAGFRYSGAPHYERAENDRWVEFRNQTGIELAAGCGIDTTVYQDDWHGVSPKVEVVVADFTEPWEPTVEQIKPKRKPAPVAPVEQLVMSDLLNEGAA